MDNRQSDCDRLSRSDTRAVGDQMGPNFLTRAESEALLRQQSPPCPPESTMWLQGGRLLTLEL
jgi:hypothetical protein